MNENEKMNVINDAEAENIATEAVAEEVMAEGAEGAEIAAEEGDATVVIQQQKQKVSLASSKKFKKILFDVIGIPGRHAAGHRYRRPERHAPYHLLAV